MDHSFYTQNLSLASEPTKNRVSTSGMDVCRGRSAVLPTQLVLCGSVSRGLTQSWGEPGGDAAAEITGCAG